MPRGRRKPLTGAPIWGDNQPDNRPILVITEVGRKWTSTMTRQRTPEPYVQQKVSIPATLLARFSRFHWNPTLNRVEYGAISKVLTVLLTDYVNKMENPPSIVPDQEPPAPVDKEKLS